MPRLLVAVLVLAAGGAARADGYHHVPRLPPRPPAATPAPPPAAPTVDVDAVLSIDELRKLPRAQDEQILVQLIDNTPDTDVEEKTDLYFRLGTFYVQELRAWHLRARGLTGQPLTQAEQKAKGYLLRAVKTFKALTDNDAFRTYARLDTALFYYGYALQAGKYMKEARAVYDKLLKNYPNSKYVPEAHLAFAEYFFANGQLADAEPRYKMVLKFPRSPAYWYATYKMGWIYVGNRRFEEALEAFFQVVQATKADSAQLELARAARQDFVRAYAEVGKPDKALAAFERVDPKAARQMLAALADLYAAQGKVDQARALGSPDATACTPQLGDRARAAHLAGDLIRAERLYADYAACVPDATDRAEMAYFRAETLWAEAEAAPDAEHWARAAEAFAPFAATDAEAALAAASAARWANALDAAVDLPAAAAAPVPVPRPLAGRDATLATAFAAALPRLTDPDEIVQAELGLAVVLRRAHHLDEVARLTADVVAHHPAHASAELAANLLLEAMLGLERYDALLELADKLHADTAFLRGKPELAQNLAFVRSRSLRRR